MYSIHGRFGRDRRFNLAYLPSRWECWSLIARSKTRCAQDLASRLTSTGVKGKTVIEVPPVSEYELSIRCCKAISKMKGTSVAFRGSGQIANDGPCGPHSGCASSVSCNPGHRPTSQPWPSGLRHSNLPRSISVRANNVCNGPSHRSMPTRCSLVSAIAIGFPKY